MSYPGCVERKTQRCQWPQSYFARILAYRRCLWLCGYSANVRYQAAMLREKLMLWFQPSAALSEVELLLSSSHRCGAFHPMVHFRPPETQCTYAPRSYLSGRQVVWEHSRIRGSRRRPIYSMSLAYLHNLSSQ